jgi:membrane-associated phospholipid phosphatase
MLTSHRNWRKYRKTALFVLLLAILVPMVSVHGLKILSGRVRFHDLASDLSNYTPWYIFQGPNNIDSSFPSGHTAMAWMLLPLFIPLWKGKMPRSSKIIWTGIILGWGIFVAVSRVVNGAHYASDVLFSTGLAFLACCVIYRKLYCSTGHTNR